jgi:hypothetical protein
MPRDVYESLSLWKLSEGGEEISLTSNTTIFPVGIAEGVFTKVLGKIVSTDYLVIECVGKGQITLGRSLLKLLGATIDVGKGTINLPLHLATITSFLELRRVRNEDVRLPLMLMLHLILLDSHFLRLAQRR